jgi:hypothetical protein
VRHIHQPKLAEHRIERSVGNIQFLAVHGAGLHLSQAAFAGNLERKRDNALREVGRQHVTVRADAFGRADRRFTSAGGNVQHPLTRP